MSTIENTRAAERKGSWRMACGVEVEEAFLAAHPVIDGPSYV